MGHCGAAIAGGSVSVITGGDDSYDSVEIFYVETNEHYVNYDLGNKRSKHACTNWASPDGYETVVVAGKTLLELNFASLGTKHLGDAC